MAIFKLNEQGYPEEIVDLTLRSRTDLWPHDRVTKIGALKGRVELEARFNRSYEALFDMTPEEALRVAVQLVDAAEEAEVQQQATARELAEAEAFQALERLPKPRRRRASP